MNIAQTQYSIMVQKITESLPDDIRLYADKTSQRKAIRSAARSVLPNATETKLMMTGNVRAWRWFIEQRSEAVADAEIRRLALLILDVLKEEAPLLFSDFETGVIGDGSRIATPRYSKI